MKLKLQNIGKIREGEVDIGGLTIIAGENDTGKSTIGKVLYSLIKGKDGNLLNILNEEFKKNLLLFGKNKGNIEFGNINVNIFKKLDKFDISLEKNSLNFKDVCLFDNLELEMLKLKKHTTTSTGGIYGAILPDSKIVTEDINLDKISQHKVDLLEKVKHGISKYSLENNTKNITNFDLLEEISNIIGGYWEFNDKDNEFYFVKNENSNNYFPSSNTASGIKSFLIIDGLIKGSYLNENSLLIIDEPEAHLHPEWQIKYAELIVRLLRESIPIVVITHSGDFLQGLINLVKKDNEMLKKLSISYASNTTSGTIVESGGYNIEKNEELLSRIYDVLAAPSWRIINGD